MNGHFSACGILPAKRHENKILVGIFLHRTDRNFFVANETNYDERFFSSDKFLGYFFSSGDLELCLNRIQAVVRELLYSSCGLKATFFPRLMPS